MSPAIDLSPNELISKGDSILSKFSLNSQVDKTKLHLVDTHIIFPRSNVESNFGQTLRIPAYFFCFFSAIPSELSVDRYLSIIPSLQESADFLLNQLPRLLSSKDGIRVLNVCQGEVAHAVPSQCDVIASDHATTCHIIAIRSVSEDANAEPLTSMAHIDKPGYESCIRNIIQTHKRHHGKTRINMDLHLMGGFNDADNSSREISESLITTFSRISSEESENLSLTLKTCAISHMNDNGNSAPIGRGLGLDLQNGKCFLATVDESVAGPGLLLRQARLWSDFTVEQLIVIHTPSNLSTVIIHPFKFGPVPDSDEILIMSDSELLQLYSTSPEAEKDEFCHDIRRTIKFMKEANWKNLFGWKCKRPLAFERSGKTNDWRRVMESIFQNR